MMYIETQLSFNVKVCYSYEQLHHSVLRECESKEYVYLLWAGHVSSYRIRLSAMLIIHIWIFQKNDQVLK